VSYFVFIRAVLFAGTAVAERKAQAS